MNYPVKGANPPPPPKIYKLRGIKEVPFAPSSKDNDDTDGNHMPTYHHTITVTTNNMRIVRQEVMNSLHQKYTTGVARKRLHNGHAPHSTPR